MDVICCFYTSFGSSKVKIVSNMILVHSTLYPCIQFLRKAYYLTAKDDIERTNGMAICNQLLQELSIVNGELVFSVSSDITILYTLSINQLSRKEVFLNHYGLHILTAKPQRLPVSLILCVVQISEQLFLHRQELTYRPGR